jgi:hypothetical protein
VDGNLLGGGHFCLFGQVNNIKGIMLLFGFFKVFANFLNNNSLGGLLIVKNIGSSVFVLYGEVVNR